MHGSLIQYDWYAFEKRHAVRKWSCDDEVRDWSEISTSQSTSKISSKLQKLEEAIKNTPLQIAEEALPCWHPDFSLLASRTTMRQ